MENKIKYKIYILSSSDSIDNIRYVGYTKKKLTRRLTEHLYDSKEKRTHKDKWIAKQIAIGNKIVIRELESNIEEDKIDEKEIFYISHYKLLGYKLTNATEGGGGCKNPSEETRRKMSLASKGRTSPRKGVKLSQETKEKIRQANLGTKQSKSTIHKRIESRKGYNHTQETIEKIKKSNKGKNKGREAWNKGLESTPKMIEHLRGLAQSQKGVPLSKEHREKISKNNSRFWLGKKKSIESIEKRLNTINNKNEEEKEKIKQKMRVAKQKPIIQYSKNMDFICEFKSIKEAQEILKLSHISECCTGKRKTIGGFIWRYK